MSEETEDYYDDDCPCNTCPQNGECDGWEMQFCCALCHYSGLEDCENCNFWDL